ncbi:Methylthioribose-1-phosphate isomerase [Pseudobythopirellula maris]|uniref:Methylthioribose-1-phosphate isomerase n=1 Tax=Pseudobythopirellula maris TaxID=2527991 RepID=A0A5C5ZNR3_9BACT|nr:S-methyl-5-thioribose-1-phosphate isomerase [Pseudobythopirellula maris]TWT88830.1 Methylthioribose-1-phosphate isomerase [Pseudobythopirellula maris]
MSEAPNTISWTGGGDGFLTLLDQTRLPGETAYLNCEDVESVYDAIKRLAVRGAPAIGIAAAYGVCLATRETSSLTEARTAALAACDRLAESRPTAVNLFWALERMRGVITAMADDTPVVQFAKRLAGEARAIHDEDRAQCAAIGRHGAELLAEVVPPGGGVLTHCNTGALATGGDGTALAVLFALHRARQESNQSFTVFADETRPLLQGARLTMWELIERGVPATLICDSMAAQVMREGRVQAVIVGADRIAANGDAANKIGTYGLAVLAKHHGVPFYVAAPSTTFDLELASGDEIPIEERAAEEITDGFGRRTAPEGAQVYNPAFDVAPAALVTAIITERGVISPVTGEEVAAIVGTEIPA